jgi:hypothetical protein
MMETTESLNPKSKLLCSVRGEWVEALPEERVRQGLIRLMTEQLGYPSELLMIERALHQFPHLAHEPTSSFPRRRADLVCYGKGIHPDFPLYPLLLIECKAVPLTSKAIQQLTGYNHYLKAPFVALCNASEIKTGYFDATRKGYVFIDRLPFYRELLEMRDLSI